MSPRPRRRRRVLGLLVGFLVLVGVLYFAFGRSGQPADSHATLRVLTYSSFMSAWGPGPELARKFREQTGVNVEFQDAGDAGLILQKLRLFPVDLVLGLDQFSLGEAHSKFEWRGDFVSIDQAPLAFVYRSGEIEPPLSLRDLLSPRFAGQIAIEDPRTSTPGLLFFLWVLDSMGEENGFKFFSDLRANIHSVSPSWSTAYGAFTKKQAHLVLSYLTSPIYHAVEEKNPSYRAAIFSDGQPLQVEYAGVPSSCSRCVDAESFIHFLRELPQQSLIMKKNYMLPAVPAAALGTPFASLPEVRPLELKSASALLTRRAELFERWRKLGL